MNYQWHALRDDRHPEGNAYPEEFPHSPELHRLHENSVGWLSPERLQRSKTVYSVTSALLAGQTALQPEREISSEADKPFDAVEQALRSHVYDETFYRFRQNISSEQEKEGLFFDTVAKIGAVVDHFLPLERRKMFPESRKIIREIRDAGGVFSIESNGYVVPWSLTGIKSLVRSGVLAPEDVAIQLSRVNFQEGVSFVKMGRNGHEDAISYFEPGKDRVQSLVLDFGEGTSVAHGCAFYDTETESGEYGISVVTEPGVFLGINALVWSGSVLREGASLWWNAHVGTNVVIGRGSVVGMSASIAGGTVLPDYSLVPDGASIGPDSPRVAFADYVANRTRYDSTLVQRGRKLFFIGLDEDESIREAQLSAIDATYLLAKNFNRDHVAPENEVFAAVDALISLLHRKIGEGSGIIEEKEFINPVNPASVAAKFSGRISVDRIGLARCVQLSLRAYPKDPEEFIVYGFPKLLDEVARTEWADPDWFKRMVHCQLDFPELPEDYRTAFLGRCILTGKIRLAPWNLLYDVKIRADEQTTSTDEYTELESGNALAKVVVHGAGRKRFSHVVAMNAVLHGKLDLELAAIGDPMHSTVINNTEIRASNVDGDVAINNARIMDSGVSHGSRISAVTSAPARLSRVLTSESSHFGSGVRLENVEILPIGYSIDQWVEMYDAVVTPNGILSKRKGSI